MAAQRPIASPFKIMGPFLGLDTWHEPRDISARHAVRAENVLLDKGTIQPRPPFEVDARFALHPEGRVYAGIDWYPPAITNALRNLVTVLHVDGSLFSTEIGVISGVKQRQGSFVFAQGRLYYLDGERVFRTDGMHGWSIAGIPPPTTSPSPNATDQQVRTGSPAPSQGAIVWMLTNRAGAAELPAGLAPNTTYQFGFSWYDANGDSESNAVFTNPVSTTGLSFPIFKFLEGTPPPQRGVTHVRAYARNVTAGEVAYVLWYQFSVSNPNYASRYEFLLPPAGSPETGPFAPYVNGMPEFANVGLYYKSRMLYNDLRDPSKLRYSSLGHPEHVRDVDFETCDDDGGIITGMAEYAGQAVVLKERGAWVLSGSIVRPTNETINTGAALLNSPHEWYKTKITVGCANAAGGNGAVVLGGRVLYNTVDGFYQFDGVMERNTAERIANTWKAFVGDQTLGRNQAVSYGHDPDRRILYLVNLSVDNERVKVLAFHYDTGAWTTLSPDDPADNPSCILPLVGTQDPGAPQDPSGTGRLELRPVSLALAVDGRRILVTNESRDDLPMPKVDYESGRMRLVEGLDGHFYAVKWHLNDVEDAGVRPRLLDVGYRTRPRNIAEFKTLSLTDGLSAWHQVSEEGTDLVVLLKTPDALQTFWHKQVSISGFEVDGEAVGQQ